jgi:3'-5' exoribonuclease
VLLKHLLLSHHGQYEYGSPKRPKTMEAVILNFLDDLDSKINGVRTHMEKEPESASAWTSYHRLYDRYFFKTSPAETEIPAAALAMRPADPLEPGIAPLPVTASVKGERPARKEIDQKRLGFTLADQLRGKSLDLFSAEGEGKE